MDEEKAASGILGLVRQINMSMKRRMISGASGMGFSMTQFLVMYELTHAKSMTMHNLQEKCGLPKSTLSRVVDQLVKLGVLARTRPEDNRRVVMLSVTASYLKEKAKLKQSVEEKIAARLKPGKAAAIKKSLEELFEIIKFNEEKEVQHDGKNRT